MLSQGSAPFCLRRIILRLLFSAADLQGASPATDEHLDRLCEEQLVFVSPWKDKSIDLFNVTHAISYLILLIYFLNETKNNILKTHNPEIL